MRRVKQAAGKNIVGKWFSLSKLMGKRKVSYQKESENWLLKISLAIHFKGM